MELTPFRVVHISDTHLYSTEDQSLLGVNTQDSFNAVLDLIKADPIKPQLIIISGDLSQDGDPKSYERLADQLSYFGVPIHCVPGNHDNNQVMSEVFPYKKISMHKHVIMNGWQFILLNSQIEGEVEGYLKPSDLEFMKECLSNYPNHFAIIIHHHHPIVMGSQWLDKLGMKNAEKEWKVLGEYPQTRAILFGHVHQEYEGIKNNIRCFSTPSTCVQFKKDSVEFSLENLPPGYRILDLHPDGSIKTSVKRAKSYVGIFQDHPEGY